MDPRDIMPVIKLVEKFKQQGMILYSEVNNTQSTIAPPLHALSKKNAPFAWGPLQSTAFDELKSLLTHAPILLYPTLTKLLRFIAMQVVMELVEF